MALEGKHTLYPRECRGPSLGARRSWGGREERRRIPATANEIRFNAEEDMADTTATPNVTENPMTMHIRFSALGDVTEVSFENY